MRKYFRHHLPDAESVRNNRWIRPFGQWLEQPNLWHLNRRSVAGGVAVGLFCGLIPGPLQMIFAALSSVLFRVNLPIALVTTLYTNPFTIVPLYVLAYEMGVSMSGAEHGLTLAQAQSGFPDMRWDNGIKELFDWMMSLGQPLLIGLPLLAASLAVAGYVAVRVIWRASLVLRWRARKRRRERDF